MPNTENNVNPLQSHFRTPGMSISLPSNGAFYKDEVEFDSQNEIEIYPMTAGDEMVLQNPDALLTGKALAQVIQSCVPQIKNVQSLVAPDIDAIFLSIRAVTLGSDMEFNTTCPNCSQINSLTIDTNNIINGQKTLNPPYIVKLEKDLIATVKPYTFADQMKAAMAAFEETKKLQSLDNESKIENLPEVSRSLDILNDVKLDVTVGSIISIITNFDEETREGKEVTDKKFIKEFLQNSHKKYLEAITKEIEIVNQTGIEKTQTVTCQKCKHDWETEIEVNPVNFFE